jgi:uncharacterized SAM-binding protein YcdF (DUF218 family)
LNPLFFHKFFPVLVLPLGASLLMLAAALRWRSRTLVAIPLALLWILSTPVVADSVMRSLEDHYAYRTNTECPDADAVFALGGGILGPRDRPGAEVDWGPSAARFERALSLYTSGRAPVLVLSAGGPRDPGQLGEGARLKEIAIRRGVPSEAVIVTRETLNTASEAKALAELSVRLHWKRVLLVTSAFHMPRAMRLFRDSAGEVIPVPVNYQTSVPGLPLSSAALDQYLPQAEALLRSERALREYLGLIFYSLGRNKPESSHPVR